MSLRRASCPAGGGPPELHGFLEAIVAYGKDVAPRLILADWLEEHDRPHEAELLRLHVALLATCCDPDKHPERVQQQARLVELLAAGVRPCVPRRTIASAWTDLHYSYRLQSRIGRIAGRFIRWKCWRSN